MASMIASDRVSDADYLAIQRFLYRETALLDRRAFKAWLELLTADAIYRVTARLVRDAALGDLDYAIIDEDAAALSARIAQIADPRLTHAENPPVRTRRFIANFEARAGTAADEFAVETNLLVYRGTTANPSGALYVGAREDLLRRIDGDLRLARRIVRLDQSVLTEGALSTIL